MRAAPSRVSRLAACTAALLLALVARAADAAVATAPHAAAPEAAAPENPALETAAAAAARATLARLAVLRAARPGDGLLGFIQAMQHATLGERDAALRELRALQGRRLGLIPVEGFGFDALWPDAEFQRVRAALAAEETPVASAPVLHRLPDAHLVPEGIAWDGAQRRLYLGSLRHRIVAVDASGRTREFVGAAAGLDAVLGVSVDAPRARVCAVTTNAFEDSARVALRNAVACFRLRDARLGTRIEAPDAAQLNDLAIARDGAIYATDSGGHGLFRAAPGATRFERVGEAGAFRGINGIALAPDGALYAALATGVARVDPATGAVALLPQPDDVVTGGIDGLCWYAGDLIGVQNVFNPARVVRIRLADDGRRVTGLAVLQTHHHPTFDEPTTAAIAGDRLVVIANSYVGRYRPDGTLREPDTMRGTALLAIELR